MKELGELKHFLGLEVEWTKSFISSQHQYTKRFTIKIWNPQSQVCLYPDKGSRKIMHN
jgi:hypothetical protein